ncbi:hypothetical protein EJ04DRAFT_86839 [Polyplosphaeria fusca]|uniref:Channel forming colicins domain-containing protein n=1 Tax=Polyplosphaeria fusca TaxID=682080 RepID=A0A9P4R6Q9_9PLEO|nr:hypothetical protein EJ04DRAFT_86839 [Polyplosphaeria fusca]
MAATVLIPCALDACVLTERCCDETNNYKIAPITQPNYTFLRIHDKLLENDVLDHIDLHSAVPADLNSRITDLGSGTRRESRLGVYLHWTIPHFYRMGSSGAGGATADPSQNTPAAQAERKRRQGFPSRSGNGPSAGAAPDTTAPDFRPLPNRWLITRRIDRSSLGTEGVDYPKGLAISDFEAWVVESDALSNIDEIGQQYGLDFDLEAERSPFLSGVTMSPDNTAIIDSQAEVFIGKKTKFTDWDSTKADAGASVDLTVLASSNPLFVDFTHHNMNVFSIVDNFGYTITTNNKQSVVYLKKAKADYSVIGWHSKPDSDPLTTYQTQNNAAVPTHAQRLQDCRMRIKSVTDDVQAWLDSATSPSRVLCHASKYGVMYDRTSQKPASTVSAETAGLAMLKKQPISIGATPIDAFLAFCNAHKDAKEDKMQSVYQDLLRIQHLLRETEDDDVDGLQAAADESYEQSFHKIESGTQWHFKQPSDPNQKPAEATPQQVSDLQKLNRIQAVVDNLGRECKMKQWYLFAAWWNYVSGFIEVQKGDRYRQDIKSWMARLNQLIEWQGDDGKGWQKLIGDLKKGLQNPSKGTSDRFFLKKDPTILVGNMSRGWDEDFLDKLPVRLSTQVVTANPKKYSSSNAGWDNSATYFKQLLTKMPSELQSGVAALLDEFRELNPANDLNTKAVDVPRVIPWYHDEKERPAEDGIAAVEDRHRDQWQNTQPWRPLFIEWEANYYHIPFDKWELKEHDRFSNWGAKVVHYGPKEDLSKAGEPTDRRLVYGRSILTPSAASTLQTTLTQIFNNTNPDDLEDPNKYNMPPETQAKLLKMVAQLETVSTPMTGLTSHLLTKCEGAHLKPLVRQPNQAPLPILTAQRAIDPALKNPDGSSAVNSRDLLVNMDVNTTLTPYGDIATLTNAPPMKPVTHGQLMFTKLNIIDKFGQVVCAIDPGPRRPGPIKTITPCLSDSYFPGTVNGADPKLPATRANTVIPQSTNDACPFISLPPSMNQPSRLRAGFVVKDRVTSRWRTATDWDLDPGPVVGWMVVNYANQGLQLFFPDGTFYREVRLGGRHKTNAGFKFLPFDPPPDPGAAGAATELDKIINLLTARNDPTYLRGFFDMINQSIDDNQVHAPKTYATYSSAIVGKPLAIVNAGWSIELDCEENRNWSTFYQDFLDKTPQKPTPTRTILNGTDQRKQNDPLGYTFPVKIGDKERAFDGLVGYFLPKDPSVRTSTDIDYTRLYTYFTDTLDSKNPGKDPRISINPSNFPKFTPYWIPPSDPSQPAPSHDPFLQVLTLIMDPFLPVHAYSAVLPNKSLRLPPYTVERALKRISAFWATGPLLSSIDVSPYNSNPDAAITANYIEKIRPPVPGTPAAESALNNPLPLVHLPLSPPSATQGGGGAQYRYLQPYFVENKDWKDGMSIEDKTVTRFNAFGIDGNAAAGSEALEAKLAKGPYTAIEGYLQVVKSIVEDQVVNGGKGVITA